MTDETRSRPGVKNATGLESYAQRIAAMDARKGEANTERAVLERDLGLELESFQRMQREPDHQRLYREFFRALGVAVKDSGLPTFEAVSELLGRFKNAPVQPSATTPAGSCPTGLPLIWEVVRDATAAKDRGDRAEEDRLLALAKRHLDLWIAINKRPGAREELGAYAKVPEPDPHKEAREQARAFAEANAKTWREAGAEPQCMFMGCAKESPHGGLFCQGHAPANGKLGEALGAVAEPSSAHVLTDAVVHLLASLNVKTGSHATVVLEVEEDHFLALAKDSGLKHGEIAAEFRISQGPHNVLVKRRK